MDQPFPNIIYAQVNAIYSTGIRAGLSDFLFRGAINFTTRTSPVTCVEHLIDFTLQIYSFNSRLRRETCGQVFLSIFFSESLSK